MTVLAMIGSAPYTVNATIAPVLPIPKSTAPSAIRPIAGAACPNPATVMIGLEKRRIPPRVSMMPSGIATAHVSSVAARLTTMCWRSRVRS